ncbi:MAG TPA: tRNA glutamyl-Q(34) synthetase GluQRS [Thermoanaerobaculia bacterium]|nr:tRNA glutamyl-Q(34) synthetase GluQRS [Thermoanaerobaculia bacterium]
MSAAGGPPPPPPRGRYAPSPTGPLHLGNARTALAAWLSVRRAGGSFVWREEDLDPPRVVAGMAAAQRADLAWLGIDWDEGPDVGGPCGPYRQSERAAHYEAALAELAAAGKLFPCRRSRRDLAAIASAPHGAGELPPYPAAWRPRRLAADWFQALGPDAALRFRTGARAVRFVDRVQGEQVERVDQTVGDFVLKRRDGLYAYQLAVVVDDLRMGIDEVVRGADLLASTARQVQLLAALGGAPPAYAHLPLVVGASGKLSKREPRLTLAGLRAAGAAPAQVTGYLAWSLGLLPAPAACLPGDLVAGFDWRRIGRGDFVVPDDLAARVLAVR